MFNLIVAVISIALIAAMAAASIFYGGAAFGSGTAQAQASTLINNGQQISGAQQLYMIENSGNRNGVNLMTDPNGLVAQGYLQAVPTPPANSTGANATDIGTWRVATNGTFAYVPLNTAQAGATTSPAASVCAELVSQGAAANITLAAATTLGDGSALPALGDRQFACVISDGGTISGDGAIGTRTAHFVFKL
jgi:hypothetical protein